MLKKSIQKRVEHHLISLDVNKQKESIEKETIATSEVPSLPGGVLELNVKQMEKSNIIEMRNKSAKKLEEVLKKTNQM